MTRTTQRPRPRRTSAGFTLLEMLTVVIIVGLLLAIGTPSVLHLQLIAMRQASLVSVRLIESGCESYFNDHEEYPPSTGILGHGRLNIVRALVGPDGSDGADGLGFRLPSGNKVWGPYNGCEEAKMKIVTGDSKPSFVDTFDYPICYYRWNGSGYDAGDNSGQGPTNLAKYAKKNNGTGSYYRKDYLLISKGPDGSWPEQVVANYENENAAYEQRDDITNFLQED